MTPELFEKLLKRGESTRCDFKLELTLLKDDKDKEANFIKDIVAFANTIRKEDAYIIIGVDEIKATGELIPKGIQQRLNDATLQDKVKDKIRPRPSFEYYEYKHNDNNTYGIIKIPLVQYDRCLVPIQTVKQNVLDKDKVYYRSSTQNQEATTDEIIRISNWFKSPYFPNENNSKPTPYSTKEIQDFINSLKSELEQIDLEAKWSDENFVELEVEIIQKKKDKKGDRKVKSLLEFTAKEKASKSFLLLGEAGAGKSVALRKLSKDLLNEKEFSKIPIYLNLRDLKIELGSSLFPQIKDYLYSDYFGNDLAKNFIQIRFADLYNEGKLFFILDSFDENITVIDELDGSEKIDKISKIINDLVSANNQVIVASREFKKPTEKFLADNTLEILPLSREKTLDFFKNLNFDKQVLAKLDAKGFKPLARNPFTATLIKEFYEFNQRLPQNQFELYDNFIQNRLNQVKNKNLVNNEIIDYAKKIADVLSENQGFGLDISVAELQNRLPQIPLTDLLPILKQARLIRTGNNRFSFTHKRFYEYFIALGFKDNPDKISIEDIPLDKRRVDAIALYCEIAEENKAKEIIDFCWDNMQYIDNQNTKKYQYGINCLKFLANAFKARTQSLECIEEDLKYFIENIVFYSDDLLLKKYAIRATALLNESKMKEILIQIYPNTSFPLSDEIIELFKYTDKLELSSIVHLFAQIVELRKDDLINEKLNDLKHFSVFKPIISKFCTIKVLNYVVIIGLGLGLFQYEILNPESLLNLNITKVGFILVSFISIFPFIIMIFHLKFIFILYKMILQVFYRAKMDSEKLNTREYHWNSKYKIYSIITIIWCLAMLFLENLNNDELRFKLRVSFSIPYFLYCLYMYRRYKLKEKQQEKKFEDDKLILEDLKSNYQFMILRKKDIERDFYKFKTPLYRKEYINLVKEKIQNYIPEGEWTDGKRPYHSDNDPASILLAELDEKWILKK